MLSCARVSADNSALSYNQSNQSELTCAEMQDIGMDPWLRDLLYDAYKVSLGPLHRTKCYYLGAMCALPKNHGYGGCDLSEEDTVCKAWFKPGYKISQLMFVLMFVALVSAFFTGGASCLVYLAVAAVANSVALVIMALCLLGLVFGTALVILATFIMMPVFPLLDYYEIWHVHYEILFCWRGASFSKFIFFPQLVLILQPLKNLGKAVDIAEEAKPATYGPISLSKLGLRLTNYGLENLKQANNAVNDWGNLLLLDCRICAWTPSWFVAAPDGVCDMYYVDNTPRSPLDDSARAAVSLPGIQVRRACFRATSGGLGQLRHQLRLRGSFPICLLHSSSIDCRVCSDHRRRDAVSLR